MSGLGERFVVSAGTVVGREHRRLQRNNQDAWAVQRRDEVLVAAVADGCSCGARSEVGASLAAAWLAGRIPEMLAVTGIPTDDLPEALCEGLLEYLHGVSAPLQAQAGSLPALVQDYLLFTLVVAVVHPARTLVFGLGDGVVSVNGLTTVVDAGAGNAPPYLAYRLIPQAVGRDGDLVPQIHFHGPTAEVQSLVIATDGAAALVARAGEVLRDGSTVPGMTQFETDPVYGRNPTWLQKRLLALGDVHQLLSDDTTLVVIRRREDEPCK